MSYKRLWIALALVLVISFAVLGGVGVRVLNSAPPIPAQVVTTNGQILFTGEDIRDGQNVWQSIGGQEVGTIWGHGSYVAPDWTADWIHRECMFLLDKWAVELGAANYAGIDVEHRAALTARLQKMVRTNTYDSASNTIVVDPAIVQAFDQLSNYYTDVFSEGRSDYAIQKGALSDPVQARQMSAFFWWTAWAASTNRAGTNVTYTQNWPHEPLIGNEPTGGTIVWSVVSFVLLLAGIGGMVWYFASQPRAEAQELLPQSDPLLGLSPTPSQRATIKYFVVVALLFLAQVLVGGGTAHYRVSAGSFYGIDLSTILPSQILRTWHLQLAIFWIAASYVAGGLFLAPSIGGNEPRAQTFWVNVLFGALVVVVVGSLLGEFAGVHQWLGRLWSWFGDQGWEYPTSGAPGS